MQYGAGALTHAPGSMLLTAGAGGTRVGPNFADLAATRAAVIALDRTDKLPLRGGTSWSSVVLHELAHTMGLAHVADRAQLMATVLPRSVASLQAGDRTGLSKVGRDAGCVVVPT